MKHSDNYWSLGAMEERLLNRFNKSWFIALCFIFTWAVILIGFWHMDNKMYVIMDYVNNPPVWSPSIPTSLFNTSSTAELEEARVAMREILLSNEAMNITEVF